MAALSHMPNDIARHASEEEVALAFAALSTADYARLARVAQLRARGLPELDWRDLLQEATERALSGARRWPLNVPFVVFVAETMRSVASEAWRRRAREALRTARAGAEESDAFATVPDPSPDAERTVVARDLLVRLADMFADDPQALAVLLALAEGLTPSEIEVRQGLDMRTYDSIRRRMRRKISRLDPETFL